MPSELDTCIREPPADNLPARPWHDNSTRSNTHRMAIESFLNPSPPAATPIFQDLLPIAKLLLPPECPPKTSSPNTTYKCIACYRIYRKRASLQYHIGTVHLPIYPTKPWPPLTCVCGRLVCSWNENLLCFSNHCCGEWRALTDSDRLFLRALEQTIDSFRSRINQEFPRLTHELVDRLARAQLRQFGRVIENIGKHAQTAVHNGCNKYCFMNSLPREVVDAFRGRFTSPFFLSSLSLDKLSVNTPYHIRAHMQFLICMHPGCTSTFINKTGWFHHVSRLHRQSCNCRYNADKDIKQICYFCDTLYTCEGLGDHLTEHMKHITSLLF
ncbi:hypothetical protein BDV29DRAFT_191063 [Aspergillus leporis]|uniref:C2H2-type domain-containing protein n=1 Tax=Aspergillus leporis TaxID=41062 RepID=A0A5N5X506_9EURO|nr:hypothetical protein BDV29DRAFT_191063 [Aspergillus leporis]